MPLTIEPISVESVSPGGNATHSLRCDRRYHQMRYRTFVNGVATPVENVINKIIVTVNRQERRNLSVPRIRMINAVNLFSDPIDTVTMHFAEPWQEGYEAATRTAWDLAGAQSAEVTLDLKGQAAGAVVAIEALMVYDMGIHLFDTDGKITGTAGTPVFSTFAMPRNPTRWLTVSSRFRTRPFDRTFVANFSSRSTTTANI